MPFTAATVQFAPRMGDVAANLERMAEIIRQCASEGADLVVFPEAAVSGYMIEGGVTEVALAPADLCSRLAELVGKLDHPVDVVVGFYETAHGQPHNSAAYLELGENPKVLHVYRKFFLPTYGVFDENRYCQAGHDVGVFNTRLGRIAILICEDVWHSILCTLCAIKGADVAIVPIASPARGFSEDKPSNVLRYERMLKALSDEHGMYAISSCLSGFEGGKGLAGASRIYSPYGECLAESPALGESIVMSSIDIDLVAASRAKSPLLSDLQARWARVRQMFLEAEPGD
jgi:predicted amidohydrolase